ncbi:hypothetical protein D1BOALGB6SA_9164 [Olavius sp. associated proteobacterium Delta 1]|nr:hypothetical protein D1BOALGB6SA_9164 [Olavius sp. associated proteobacterium Delta 1]
MPDSEKPFIYAYMKIQENNEAGGGFFESYVFCSEISRLQ